MDDGSTAALLSPNARSRNGRTTAYLECSLLHPFRSPVFEECRHVCVCSVSKSTHTYKHIFTACLPCYCLVINMGTEIALQDKRNNLQTSCNQIINRWRCSNMCLQSFPLSRSFTAQPCRFCLRQTALKKAVRYYTVPIPDFLSLSKHLSPALHTYRTATATFNRVLGKSASTVKKPILYKMPTAKIRGCHPFNSSIRKKVWHCGIIC